MLEGYAYGVRGGENVDLAGGFNITFQTVYVVFMSFQRNKEKLDREGKSAYSAISLLLLQGLTDGGVVPPAFSRTTG